MLSCPPLCVLTSTTNRQSIFLPAQAPAVVSNVTVAIQQLTCSVFSPQSVALLSWDAASSTGGSNVALSTYLVRNSSGTVIIEVSAVPAVDPLTVSVTVPCGSSHQFFVATTNTERLTSEFAASNFVTAGYNVPDVVTVTAFQPSLFEPGVFTVSWSHNSGSSGVAATGWQIVVYECNNYTISPLFNETVLSLLPMSAQLTGPSIRMHTCYSVAVAAIGGMGVGPLSSFVSSRQETLLPMQPVVVGTVVHNASVMVVFNSSRAALQEVLGNLKIAYVIAESRFGGGSSTAVVELDAAQITYRFVEEHV